MKKTQTVMGGSNPSISVWPLVVIAAILISAAVIYYFSPAGQTAAAAAQQEYDDEIAAHLTESKHFVVSSILSVNAEETEASFVCVDGEILSVDVPREHSGIFSQLYRGDFKDLPKYNSFTTANYYLTVEEGRIVVRGEMDDQKKETAYSLEESAEYLVVEEMIIAVKDGTIDHVHHESSDHRAFAAMVEQLNN
jgi:hypothetical protein